MIGGYRTVWDTMESYHCKNAINLMRLCEGRGEVWSCDRGPVISTGAGHHRGARGGEPRGTTGGGWGSDGHMNFPGAILSGSNMSDFISGSGG